VGAIGVAIACFTSRRGARPIVIERHEVAGAGSGNAVAPLLRCTVARAYAKNPFAVFISAFESDCVRFIDWIKV
jgi:glycine/D-amino acid oxidase-like deaminating enzyme